MLVHSPPAPVLGGCGAISLLSYVRFTDPAASYPAFGCH
jgi:hypothetical protein